VIVGLLLAAWAESAIAAEGLRAGAAEVEITPPVGHALWGYASRRDAPSEGVLDSLFARALVLEAGGERLALVSLDLGRPPTRTSTAAIRAAIAKELGPTHLFLVATHTHHGPVLELDDWPSPKESYVRTLEKKLTDVVMRAAKAAQPARLGVASKEVDLNRNRHSHRQDRPVDKHLLVLRVEGENGKAIAHVVNFAAHPTMLDAKLYKISADYPGALAALVAERTKAPCLFLQGAAGDLSPNPGKEASHEAFGKALGREVLALADSMRCEHLKTPRIVGREESFRFDSRIDHRNVLVRAAFSAVFYPKLVAFYEREYRDGVCPQLQVALLDSQIGFVGVSGEFFSGHSLHLRKRARLEHLFFLGYCNDYQQYFPTIEAAAEGGYGADPAVSPVEFGAGERIVDRALIHLYQLRGQLKPTR
jgi:hypothetical protein